MLYAAIVGDGDAGEGLARIGEGDHPLGRAIASGTETAVEWSATTFPKTTETVFSILEEAGGAIDATIRFADDATGQVVSAQWNAIDQHTRNQLLGAGKIVSVALSAGSVKVLQGLKSANRLADTSNLAKPLGRGSTGRTTPSNLAEQLAMKEVMSNPEVGERLDLDLGDPRWPGSEGWEKVVIRD